MSGSLSWHYLTYYYLLYFLGIQFPGGGMSYMLSDEGEQAQSPVSPMAFI